MSSSAKRARQKLRAAEEKLDTASKRLPEFCHWALWLAAILPVCWRQVTTSDAWWHIALGRWLAQHQSLPDFTQFYFTPLKEPVLDLRWTALGDLLLYFTHTLGGAIALQALSLACVIAGCVLLRRLRAGPMNGWMTLLLIGVVFGTYQLQLPRNAIFSLPLTALTLWIFIRFRVTRRALFAWWLPVVVGVWSLIHASCLLGCVLVALLLAVDAIEGMRESRTAAWRRVRLATCVIAVTLTVVTVGNPPAVKMLRRPVEYVLKIEPKPRADGRKNLGRSGARAQPAPEPQNIKEWLNNLIWPATPGRVRSADFDSPLDRLSYRPVVIAFGLMIVAAVWTLWTSSPSFPMIATFAATSLLGLSYFRMTGYAALGAAALILTCGPLRGRLAAALGESSWLGATLAALTAAALWGTSAFGDLASLVGNSRHVFAPGKVPTFDDAASDWVLARHRDLATFTTIETGSYALHRWQGQKRVFIDGFFAPHADAVWSDYLRARKETERDLLRNTYGIDLAIIEHTRKDWNRVFLSNPDWQPAAIGVGCTIYAHRSVLPDAIPELLFVPESARRMTAYYRRTLARNYYGAVLAMLAADRTEAAETFIASAPDAWKRWRRWLTPAEREAVRQMDDELQAGSKK